MDYQTLQDLYVHELKDLYSAEKQIVKALPGVIKHAHSERLKKLLTEHLEQARTHVERLEQIFERMGKSTRGVKCKGMEGILEESDQWLRDSAKPFVKDTGIISHSQRVANYEIAGYGAVHAYADHLGLREDAHLLRQTLAEERDEEKTLIAAAAELIAA